MVQFSLLAALSLIPGVLAAPGEILPSRNAQKETSNEIVTRQGGYYFQNWSENGSNIRCNNGAGASYTATWNSKGGFVCGKGYNVGGSRTIKYSGTYNATGPGYLAVYGWTRNPLIEYYIIESHADLAPNEPWTSKGNFTFDEGTYEIFTSTRVNKPSIEGTRTFQQYWSVRTEKRVGGTVTTGRHFDEWAKYNMKLGNHDYVIMATEGYTADGGPGSSGSSSITLG
ncbi:concanavalin A-like lectin/glucanase domain-containing protein [Phialemonium atrogriseum]|uniref:Endo-1,4-beta-xylanase n=1 Tax=Phialemonium atrogriseum TaxID=1093897 RepID=A0AAJ0FB36_9PEZI|nr:concanavalin A-like lectin/glucanase domain-containing protein [Phialemonium atrogriseum]KAK1762056.1 concanavalin A-like lectin/glucanase domain-containing protein [Phialemonium atrogriseum]